MKTLIALCLFGAAIAPAAELKSGPPMPYTVVADWPKLPQGWTLGVCSTVTVDRQDHVWIFSRGAHPVTEFDSDGKLLRSWGEGAVRSAHGIRVDADGNVWGVDVTGQVVRKYTPDGRVLMVVGQEGKPGNNDSHDAFSRPTNVAFAPNGDFYVSDGYVNSRVVRFSKDGKYIGQWGHKGTGDGEFDLVHDIVLDKQNRLLVADRTNERIQIFDLDGKFLGKWTGIGVPWSLFYVPREDAVYMADGVNMRVVKLNMNGDVVGVLGGPGKAPGQFDQPHGIAVDSTGAIYVAEVGNQRVQKFVKP
ncbi:MAG: peptidyl-alpha-hydroxyglycine alpha-amidating lyase family protein [Bryobacteraceae bacterium]